MFAFSSIDFACCTMFDNKKCTLIVAHFCIVFECAGGYKGFSSNSQQIEVFQVAC